MGVLDALWHQNTADHSAVEYRLMLAGLLAGRGGLAHPDHLKVTQHAGTPNGTVDISPGTAFVAGSEQTWQGMYTVSADSVVNRAVGPTGADPRVDLVAVRVRDTVYSAGGDDEDIVVVAGTAAAAPVPPDLDALGYENYLILARIDVPASTSVITDAMITRPTVRAAGLGGVMVCTSGSRPAAPTPGQAIFETDTGAMLVWYGATAGWGPPWNTAWGVLGQAPGGSQTGPGIGATRVDINGTSVTVTTVTNRRLRVDMGGFIKSTVSDDVFTFRRNRDGSDGTVMVTETISYANQTLSWAFTSFEASPGSGSHTYKGRVARGIGSGSGTVADAWLTVTDIGPAGPPPA